MVPAFTGRPQQVDVDFSSTSFVREVSRARTFGFMKDIEKLREMNGTPPEILAHEELMDLMAPIVRADFTISETYTYKPGEKLTADEFREHCASIMAKHKVPRYVWFLADALPRNASGKFVKRDLRDRLSAELRSAGH